MTFSRPPAGPDDPVGQGETDDAPPDFSLDWRWPEELYYREGDNVVMLRCNWELRPPVVFVPSAVGWDATLPLWLHGRRDEIVGRIEANSDHITCSADWAY